jgi:hypothetical protein
MIGIVGHPLIRIPLRYALIGIFLYGTLFLLLYFMGNNPLVVGRPWDFGFLLIPLMVFFAMKDFKVNYNNGELRFWQGMSSGFVTYFILALGVALFIYIFMTLADPNILEGYIQDRIQLLESSKEQFIEQLGAELYDEQITKMNHTTAFIVAIDEFWKKLVIGLFLTILIAAVLRK